MIAKQIIYERVKSCNFNNEKVGIVLDIEDGEKAKIFVKKQFNETVMIEVKDTDIPF